MKEIKDKLKKYLWNDVFDGEMLTEMKDNGIIADIDGFICSVDATFELEIEECLESLSVEPKAEIEPKYEFWIEKGNTHKIESNNILCDWETGRVVAVFYNAYDLEDLKEIITRVEPKAESVELSNWLKKEINKRSDELGIFTDTDEYAMRDIGIIEGLTIAFEKLNTLPSVKPSDNSEEHY